MSAIVPDLPAESHESFADDIAGMGSFLIDPPGAARRLPHKWFWIAPLVVMSLIGIFYMTMFLPIEQHVLEIAPIPANTPPDQYQKGVQISLMVQRIFMYVMPLFILGFSAVQAAIVLGMSSILGVKAKFRSLFNLMMGCGLISSIGSIAALIVLKAKDVSTTAELKPPLGLDIFLGEGTNKFLLGTLNYFSVFQIWWIVMAILTYSVAFRVKKGTATAAIAPLVLIGLLFVLIGAAFQRT